MRQRRADEGEESSFGADASSSPSGSAGAVRADASDATAATVKSRTPDVGSVPGARRGFFPRPLRVLNIVSNEAMERLAFYGVRAVLVLYLTQSLGMSAAAAVSAFSLFSAVAYISPLLGGYLADAVVGKLHTIIGFNAVYLVGLLTLAVGAFVAPASLGATWAGLICIGLGAGGIKPNISPFGAEQIEAEVRAEAAADAIAASSSGNESNPASVAAPVSASARDDDLEQRKSSFFSFFYWSINIGSLVAFIAIPLIRVAAGFGWAFMTCLFFLLASIAVFIVPICCWGGRVYYDAPPSVDSAWNRCGRIAARCCAYRCCKAPADVAHILFVDSMEESESRVDGKVIIGPAQPPGIVHAATSGAGDSGIAGASTDGARATASDVIGSVFGGGGDDVVDEAHALLGVSNNSNPLRTSLVPLFASDDAWPGECTCVNSAVYHELRRIAAAAFPVSLPANRLGVQVVMLRHAAGGAVSGALGRGATTSCSCACCCCCCGGGRLHFDPPPHAALLPLAPAAAVADTLDCAGASEGSEILATDYASLRQVQASARDVRDVLRLLPIFAVLPIFWCVFDSTGSVWLLQRLNMGYCLGLLCLEPDMLGFLNPALVIILIPIFDQCLMPCLERCGTGLDGRRSWLFPTPLRKMAAGMQIGALAFITSGFLQLGIDAQGPPPVQPLNQWLQLPQYLLVTIAEILVSITGLEFAYSQSPPDMKSTVLALYFLCISVGDMLTAVLFTGMTNSGISTAAILFIFAALVSVAGFIFIALAAHFKERAPLSSTGASAGSCGEWQAGEAMEAQHRGGGDSVPSNKSH